MNLAVLLWCASNVSPRNKASPFLFLFKRNVVSSLSFFSCGRRERLWKWKTGRERKCKPDAKCILYICLAALLRLYLKTSAIFWGELGWLATWLPVKCTQSSKDSVTPWDGWRKGQERSLSVLHVLFLSFSLSFCSPHCPSFSQPFIRSFRGVVRQAKGSCAVKIDVPYSSIDFAIVVLCVHINNDTQLSLYLVVSGRV